MWSVLHYLQHVLSVQKTSIRSLLKFLAPYCALQKLQHKKRFLGLVIGACIQIEFIIFTVLLLQTNYPPWCNLLTSPANFCLPISCTSKYISISDISWQNQTWYPNVRILTVIELWRRPPQYVKPDFYCPNTQSMPLARNEYSACHLIGAPRLRQCQVHVQHNAASLHMPGGKEKHFVIDRAAHNEPTDDRLAKETKFYFNNNHMLLACKLILRRHWNACRMTRKSNALSPVRVTNVQTNYVFIHQADPPAF